MSDGGSDGNSTDGGRAEGPSADSAAEGAGGPLAALSLRLRRHWLAASAAAVTVLVAAVAVPVALAGPEDERPCWRLPASARDLAEDPAAATEALDPGDDLARLSSARKLLRHKRVCGDGAGVLGRIVDTATRSSGPGKPHTLAQARSAYAVAAALDGAELPDGMAPGVARMVAEYVVDAGRDDMSLDNAHRPAVPAAEARPGDDGYNWLGRFLAQREAHAAFEYVDATVDANADMQDLVAELAKDPEAFAILYDAERAYFAYYLERLTRRGGDPDHRSTGGKLEATATTWPDNDLQDLGGRVGDLMKHRAGHARDGTIPDLAAFDAAVRKHTRGTFLPAPRQLDTREPMGDIADRPVARPVKGPLTDGRHQLLTVLDWWAEKRDVPEPRAAAMRQLIDDAYVRGLWMRF